jgi:hypothetical protein
MPRDNIHYGGWENRDVHNINGMLYVSLFHPRVQCANLVPDPSPMRPSKP